MGTPQLSSPVQLKSALVASTAAATYVKTGVETVTAADVADGAAVEVDVDTGAGALFAADDLILIGTEILKVSSIATDKLTVTRGEESTTAAGSTAGDAVYLLLTDSTGALVPGAHPDVLSSVAESQIPTTTRSSAAAAASATTRPASASASRATWATAARRRRPSSELPPPPLRPVV